MTTKDCKNLTPIVTGERRGGMEGRERERERERVFARKNEGKTDADGQKALAASCLLSDWHSASPFAVRTIYSEGKEYGV